MVGLAHLPWSSIYGIRALQYLACRPADFVPLADIAEDRVLPKARLSKILQALRRAGLVTGIPGKGYRLAQPTSQIPVLAVLRALNGERELVPPCLMRSPECSSHDRCELPPLCKELDRLAKNLLSTFTLDRFPPAGCSYPKNDS